MIMTLLKFTLKPDSQRDLCDVFIRHKILETAITVEGCWKLAVMQGPAHEESLYVVGFWQDQAAYQRWLDHPDRDVANDEFDLLMADEWDPIAAGQVLNVLHSVPPEHEWK